ncbi:MAG: cytochrome P450 [Burkholderiaceae bacterium]
MESTSPAWTMPLTEIDVSNGHLFRDNTIGEYFARLRRDCPVHWCPESRFGPYWSVTRYRDIMAVELNHKVFSSAGELGGIALSGVARAEGSSFIEMDPPMHDDQRKAVSAIAEPPNVSRLEDPIRGHVIEILDSLPVGEPFDWVERVSIELTTRMLATIFDFPFEQRRNLTYWSDIATGHPKDAGPVTSYEMRNEELANCLSVFTRLWNERVNEPPQNNLISMMAHSPATRHMKPDQFLENLILLIVGGNDTTRNSISGGLLALNQNPAQYQALRENPALVKTLVPEIIRWQTPLAHMARTAREDIELNGQQIKAGDRVAMWYLSANRDESMIDRANEFIIDRPKPRQHLSFGFGLHHCVGSRLAEAQLRILWEEILQRYPNITVLEEPERNLSNFVHGFVSMPVRIEQPS